MSGRRRGAECIHMSIGSAPIRTRSPERTAAEAAIAAPLRGVRPRLQTRVRVLPRARCAVRPKRGGAVLGAQRCGARGLGEGRLPRRSTGGIASARRTWNMLGGVDGLSMCWVAPQHAGAHPKHTASIIRTSALGGRLAPRCRACLDFDEPNLGRFLHRGILWEWASIGGKAEGSLLQMWAFHAPACVSAPQRVRLAHWCTPLCHWCFSIL